MLLREFVNLFSRGIKRQNRNISLPHKTYLPKGLNQNNHGFQCSLAQIKNRYTLSGLFREKTVKTCLAGARGAAAAQPRRAATLRVAGAPEGCRFAAAGPNNVRQVKTP